MHIIVSNVIIRNFIFNQKWKYGLMNTLSAEAQFQKYGLAKFELYERGIKQDNLIKLK